MHCISDKFEKFLDKSYYHSRENINNCCQHTFYYSLANSTFFNHKNPLLNEEHYKYYIRCINRFNKLLNLNKPKLFILTIRNTNNIELSKNNIIELNNQLKKYAINYILLVIFTFTEQNKQNHSFSYIDNIHFLELYTISKFGMKFKDETDNYYLNNILNTQYLFKLKDINN